MRKLLLLLIFIFAGYVSQAQTGLSTLNYCNLTIIRNPNDSSLLIEDATGNQVASYRVTSLPRFSPSSDCRYLAAHLRFNYGEPLVMYVWDAQTGYELATHRYSLFEWSPDNNRLYLENRTGTYLWDFVSDSLVTLSPNNINRYYPRAIWSADRGILYFSETAHNRAILPNDETVSAYNWLTGELLAEYTNLAADDIETGVELSNNERYLIVYSLHSYPEFQGITVYDLDTGAIWKLDSGTHEFINGNAQIEISPDGRYLVAANRHLWVWELPLLTDTSIEHSPTIYYGPEAWVETVTFISPNIIEVRDNGDYVSHWDVSNGQIAQSSE